MTYTQSIFFKALSWNCPYAMPSGIVENSCAQMPTEYYVVGYPKFSLGKCNAMVLRKDRRAKHKVIKR